MGTTANFSWPYPESTDFVADGATAMENLADAVDTTLGPYGNYTAYTPSFTNVTVGNATIRFAYAQVGKTVHVMGYFLFGSTSAFSGIPVISLPFTASHQESNIAVGRAAQLGVGGWALGAVPISTSTIGLVTFGPSGSYNRGFGLSATIPFTWGAGSWFEYSITYRRS